MALPLEELERLAKKQKVCAQSTQDGLNTVLHLLDSTLGSLQTGSTNVEELLSKLSAEVKHIKVNKKLSAVTREFHETVKTVGKAVDTNFEPDVCAAARRDPLPRPALNKAIAEHLYREGAFHIADHFVAEARIPEGGRSRDIFVVMHKIMKQMSEGNLQSALQWAANQRAIRNSGRPSNFEFKLHRLLYLNTLKTEGMHAALTYARTHFEQFKHEHMKDIQQLMCCLLYACKPLEESPYKHLMSASALEDVIQDFVREACGMLGQAWESPLLVSVAAGSVALPQLLKLAKVMSKQSVGSDVLDLAVCSHMPIELELGPDFNFHSIFACPVSREQSDKGNPPCMLPCGHVLCSHSIDDIAKKQSQTFKCPYCPRETQPANCRVLHFPDVETVL